MLDQSATPNPPPVLASAPDHDRAAPGLNPGMLRLLREASGHCEGQVRIERTRQGTWPDELRLLRGLESEGHLELLATRDQPDEGKVTATYAITAKGRKALAMLEGTGG
ncbi:hypothetical protein [Microvirga massiliensis]|uniref:hypothetical protein n=1 Tax=Microvirga massiliensis TaxID=1033741 RepID=UPI000AB71C0C|nr:hypothetical protein [Microvirga massiliensis]